MNTAHIILCIYMLGVVLSMRIFVERDPAKRAEHDVEISAIISIAWPISLVLCCCILTYLIVHNPDALRRRKK